MITNKQSIDSSLSTWSHSHPTKIETTRLYKGETTTGLFGNKVFENHGF
jgi:hypothetical protein